MTRLRTVFAWIGGVLALAILLVLGFVSWVLFTTPGARWVAATVTQRFAPQVKYARIDGTIAGSLTVDDFRFEGDEYTAKVRIAQMTVDVAQGSWRLLQTSHPLKSTQRWHDTELELAPIGRLVVAGGGSMG